MPTLAAIMTPFPYSIGPRASLDEARAMMEEHGIHHLPVADGEQITAIVAKSDLFAAGRLAVNPTEPVEAVADRAPYVVDIHTPLLAVVRDMAERHIGAVVVTRNGKLAGIFTHTDVCRLAASLLEPDPPRVA